MSVPVRLVALTLAGLQACSPEPEFVYIPADNYVISVEIAAPAEARAGEWVPLSAQRRSGPWKPGAALEGARGARALRQAAAGVRKARSPTICCG